MTVVAPAPLSSLLRHPCIDRVTPAVVVDGVRRVLADRDVVYPPVVVGW